MHTLESHLKKIYIEPEILARSWSKIRKSLEELQSTDSLEIEETEVDSHSSIFGYISQANANSLSSIDNEIDMYKVTQIIN